MRKSLCSVFILVRLMLVLELCELVTIVLSTCRYFPQRMLTGAWEVPEINSTQYFGRTVDEMEATKVYTIL